MTHFYERFVITCDMEGCAKTEAFDNPGHFAPYLLDAKAIEAGWYIADFGGKDLCPVHHQLVAAKVNLTSFYKRHEKATVPIDTKGKKKGKA